MNNLDFVNGWDGTLDVDKEGGGVLGELSLICVVLVGGFLVNGAFVSLRCDW